MITGSPVNVLDFGADPSGVNDSTSAIQLAINSISALGGAIYFPSGQYSITTGNINLISNLEIYGDGETSKLIASGSNAFNFFNGTNVSNISFANLWAYGNNTATASGNGQFLLIDQNTSATAIGTDYTVTNCRFENFKGDYWLNFRNENTTYPMQNFRIQSCTFVSHLGNARNGSSTGVPSACIWIQGATGVGGALATDIIISDNVAYCDYIKIFASLFQGCQRAIISNNVINNCGTDSSISNNSGAYAIIAYDSSLTNVPQQIIVSENIINNVKSCGLYFAAVQTFQIIGNRIVNQTDTVTTSLPKGGVVLNGSSYGLVENNFIENIAADGFYCIADSSTARESGISINNNKIKNCLNGIHINSVYQNNGDLLVVSNDISQCNVGINVQTFSGVYIEKINIVGNNIGSSVAGSYGIYLNSGQAAYDIRNTSIESNIIEVVSLGISWQNVTTGVVNISGNLITGNYVHGIESASSTLVNITNNSFFNQGTNGYCFYTSGSQGNLANNTFVNCTSGQIVYSSGIPLGAALPTWTPSGTNYFVQNLTPSETGTTGSKYVVQGWLYSGSWLQQRVLTGN
jgi:hypothetical protein